MTKPVETNEKEKEKATVDHERHNDGNPTPTVPSVRSLWDRLKWKRNGQAEAEPDGIQQSKVKPAKVEQSKVKPVEAEQTKADPEANEETSRIKRNGIKRLKVRLVPIWLRLLILLVLCILALVIGAMVGYGLIGKGHAFDVFDPATWQHIIDIVTKNK